MSRTAAEQVITPWEEDSAVSQCPLCRCVNPSQPQLIPEPTTFLPQCRFPPYHKPKAPLSSVRPHHLRIAREATPTSPNLFRPFRSGRSHRRNRGSQRGRRLPVPDRHVCDLESSPIVVGCHAACEEHMLWVSPVPMTSGCPV